MVSVPAAIPVAVPIDGPLRKPATEPVKLLHVPPVKASVNDVEVPTQTDFVPIIAVGFGLTVIAAVAKQPVLVIE